MHKAQKAVPSYLKEHREKPKADYPRIYIGFEDLPKALKKEIAAWPMNNHYRIILEGELVGRDTHEARGDSKEVRGSIQLEVHSAGAEAIKKKKGKKVAKKKSSKRYSRIKKK